MRFRPIKVLLIDEHEEDRTSLRRCLLKANDTLRIYEAGGGQTALDWFRAVQPDCVVLDLKLEDNLGMELVNRVVLDMSKQPIPIFIWTRLSQAVSSEAASLHGIRGYFEKHKDSEHALVKAILDATTDR